MKKLKIVVLTANIDSHDASAPVIPSDWENVFLIVFTSSHSTEKSVQHIGNTLRVSIRNSPLLARQISRIPKINPLFLFNTSFKPPSIFPDYSEVSLAIRAFIGNEFDYLVWHDANCSLLSYAHLLAICSSVPTNGWGIFAHPDRNCLYQEARAAKGLSYVCNEILKQQLSAYKIKNMPLNYGLYACGFFVRSYQSLYSSRDLWDSWMHEFLRWVPRDQISLPYCLFQHPLHRPTLLGKFTWKNELFAFKPH